MDIEEKLKCTRNVANGRKLVFSVNQPDVNVIGDNGFKSHQNINTLTKILLSKDILYKYSFQRVDNIYFFLFKVD